MPYARTRKVNLGCGHHTPEGWTHVDYALGARLSRVPFFRFLNRKLAVSVQFLAETLPLYIRHDIEEKAVCLAGIVQGKDVRVG